MAFDLAKVVKGEDYVWIRCVTLPLEASTDETLGCQISPTHCAVSNCTVLDSDALCIVLNG